jgi:exodeoxyribonuclease VIII
MIKDGFYKKLPMADYLAEDALSKSGLSNLAISPAHFKARQIEPKTFAGADLGTAVHLLVLEPERAEQIIFTPPKDTGRKSTNAYKEWVSSLDPGAIILSREEFEAAHYMRDAILSHPAASELLSNGFPEVSMFHTGADGIRRKCRPDWMSDKAYVDIKTARSASPDGFGRQAYELHYHWSAFHTIDIGKHLNPDIEFFRYYFVVVEKEAPWCVAVYETPGDLIELAAADIQSLYAQYRACIEYNTWPGYDSEVQQLKLPRWAYKKEEE